MIFMLVKVQHSAYKQVDKSVITQRAVRIVLLVGYNLALPDCVYTLDL